ALGELASKNSDFDYLAKNLLNSEIFECKEFQSPNDGDEKSIKQISLSDLESFYKKNINLSNLVVILGGNLAQEKAKGLLNKLLAKLQKGSQNSQKTYEINSKNKDIIQIRKESEQAYIYFAAPFFTKFNDKDFYLAKITLFILGQGGFGSRIMEEIRVKRGLAYSAYAMLDMNASFTRVFGYLQTKNESAKEAKKIVKEVFRDFVKEGVSQNELVQAKNFLIGSTPLRYESLSRRLSISFNEYYQGLPKGYYKEELKLIEKVELQELNAYIQKHNEILDLNFASIANEN
ncbi:insulinase family protein, partial [Campylobacter coli]|nr:insulinase family protein [Campylobacter coli]